MGLMEEERDSLLANLHTQKHTYKRSYIHAYIKPFPFRYESVRDDLVTPHVLSSDAS